MKERIMTSLAVVCNIAIVLLEIIGTSLSIKGHGILLFKYYTEDSNIFALIASVLWLVFWFIKGRGSVQAIPKWVKSLKYLSVSCLLVTFLVVVFVLAPMYGEGGYRISLLTSSMLYHHLLCPLIAAISFIFFENSGGLRAGSALTALVPTAVYAAVSLLLNILRVMKGPYPFLMVYEQPVYMSFIWCAVILGGAYLTALALIASASAAGRRLETVKL